MSDILNKLNLKPSFDKPFVYTKERDENSGCVVLYTSFWEFLTNSDSEKRFKSLNDDVGPLGTANSTTGNYNRVMDDFVPYVASHAKFNDPEKGTVEIPLVPYSVEKFKTILLKVIEGCTENKFDKYMCEVADPKNKGSLFFAVNAGVYCIDRDVDFINAFERTEDGDFIATFPSIAVLMSDLAVMEKGPDGRDWIKRIPLPE